MPIVDHNDLICDISAQLANLRKAQPEAMRGFSQLAQASMADGTISAKHKELTRWPSVSRSAARPVSATTCAHSSSWAARGGN